MKIVSTSFFKHSHCGKPQTFKGKRDLFKKTDEPVKISFEEILEEIINPKPC